MDAEQIQQAIDHILSTTRAGLQQERRARVPSRTIWQEDDLPRLSMDKAIRQDFTRDLSWSIYPILGQIIEFSP